MGRFGQAKQTEGSHFFEEEAELGRNTFRRIFYIYKNGKKPDIHIKQHLLRRFTWYLTILSILSI